MLQPFFTETPAQNPVGGGVSPAGGHHWKPFDSTATPAEMAARLAECDGFVWLDSAVTSPGAVSILTVQPTQVDQRPDPSALAPEVEATLRAGTLAGQAGGMFGWVGFDGQFVLGVYPHALLYDHDRRQWFESGGFKWPLKASGGPHPAQHSLPFTPLVTRADYIAQVERAKEYIAAGDIYQVVISPTLGVPAGPPTRPFSRSMSACGRSHPRHMPPASACRGHHRPVGLTEAVFKNVRPHHQHPAHQRHPPAFSP